MGRVCYAVHCKAQQASARVAAPSGDLAVANGGQRLHQPGTMVRLLFRSGCREVRELKDAAPEQILHFQLLPFQPPEAEKPDGECRSPAARQQGARDGGRCWVQPQRASAVRFFLFCLLGLPFRCLLLCRQPPVGKRP